MNEHHYLGVLGEDQEQIERMDSRAIHEGFTRARAKTFEVMDEIRARLREGMSEDDARLLALEIFRTHGVTKHWHRPYIRFGEGTVLSFLDPISENRLKADDVFHFDLGPVWPSSRVGIDAEIEFESDLGDTFVFGKNPEADRMIRALRSSFSEVKDEWKASRLTGVDLYRSFKKRIEDRGFVFVDAVDGHRISEFPHQKYTRERLSKIRFVPSASRWVLEALIVHPTLKMGAFYEDLMD